MTKLCPGCGQTSSSIMRVAQNHGSGPSSLITSVLPSADTGMPVVSTPPSTPARSSRSSWISPHVNSQLSSSVASSCCINCAAPRTTADPAPWARGSDAAECKSFEENLDFCFVIGKPTHEQVAAIQCTKHRRTGYQDVETIRIVNNIARVESVKRWYGYDASDRTVKRREMRIIAAPPT